MTARAKETLALAVLFVLTLPLVNPATRGDGFFYVAHLRSAVVDGDFDYANELAFADEKTRAYREPILAATGRVNNKYAVGPALLWAPYYCAAHAVVKAWPRAARGAPADGFSRPYILAVAVATAAYCFAALLLLYEMLRRYFGAGVALAATAAMWFATSLPAYMYFHPTMAHGVSFFAVTLYVYAWHETRGARRPARAAALGAAAGVMVLVRAQNAVFLLLLLLEYAARAAAFVRRRDGGAARRSFPEAAVFLAAAAAFFSPQLLYWKVVNGSFAATGYEDSFNWLRPRLAAVLFSANHGVFLWTPVIAAAVAGLALFFKRDRLLATAAAACFAAQLYIVAAWGTWWQGSSFGGRMFIGAYPLLAFGLGAAFAAVGRRVGRAAVWAAVVALTAWNFNLLVQFGTGMIPREESVRPALVVANTARVPSTLVAFGWRYLADREYAAKYFKLAR